MNFNSENQNFFLTQNFFIDVAWSNEDENMAGVKNQHE